jgi:hypothetical protein
MSVVLTWTPNYVNPETRSIAIVVLCGVLLALAYVIVGMRLWARLTSRTHGLDDALIAFNMVFAALSMSVSHKINP